MYQLILYIIFLSYIVFFLPHLFSNENHLRYNMIYVAKKICENPGGGAGVAGFSWLIVRSGVARVQNDTTKVVFHSFNYSWNYYRW